MIKRPRRPRIIVTDYPTPIGEIVDFRDTKGRLKRGQITGEAPSHGTLKKFGYTYKEIGTKNPGWIPASAVKIIRQGRKLILKIKRR